jgi:type I restriction enzyme S subunit
VKFKPYGKYKPTGVEWLGNVPDEWKVLPLFTVLNERQTKNEGNHVANVLSLSYGRIVDRNVESNHGLLPESFETYQIVEQHDIILRLTDLQNDQRSLRVGQVHWRGIITSAYACLIPTERIDPDYAYLLLHAYDTLKIFYGLGGGVRQSMKFDDLKRLPIALPSMDEQGALATFLSRETVKIDALVKKQEKLIQLLKEKRQAVISHAVAKGLDPTVPMKSSGIEWLGDVPGHWTMLRVKRVSSFITSGPRGWSNHLTDDGPVFLQSGDLDNEMGIDLNGARRVTPPESAEGRRTALRNLDVVVCITGANTGRVAVIEDLSELAFINQHLALVRPHQGVISSRFMSYWLTSHGGRTYFDVSQYGLKEGLSLWDIAEAPCPVPPRNDQEAIVEYLDATISKIDELIGKAHRAIELQKEHRTALISAAVTGKIDVREATPQLQLAA